MPLLLAIEPDSRQASLIAALARDPLRAELIMTTSAREAIKTLNERVPDLILTSLLLSPGDEAVLTARLRALDDAGSHVQTLVIPLLADPLSQQQEQSGLLKRLGWRKSKAASTPDGCDPEVFGAQIAEYLNRRNIHRVFAHLQRPKVADEPRLDSPPDDAAATEVAPGVPTASEETIAAAPFETLDDARVSLLTVAPEPVVVHAPESLIIGTGPIFLAPEPVVAEEPQRSEPLVDDLEAIGAELDAMLAAPIGLESIAPEEAIDERAAAVADDADKDGAEAEADFEPPRYPLVEIEASEPAPAIPSIRPDLLEMLAAIGRDLEPLRSTSEHRTASATRRKAPGAVQDEWGFFDPQQCGMEALLARLDQISRQKDLATGRSN